MKITEFQEKFFGTLSRTNSVAKAIEACPGLTREIIERYLKTSQTFAEGYRLARLQAIELLEDKAWDVAMMESTTATKTQCAMLMFMLEAVKPEVYDRKGMAMARENRALPEPITINVKVKETK